ncbi:MAG TPA: hypothetical protein VK974_00390 [Methylophilaceae bacterium]|nr:hypothetical protein [Methylophilaceae bacterium]
MTIKAHGIDYESELATIRDAYVSATPQQRLNIIRQRLSDHHFGPNRLVTAVSAVEALARTLVMHANHDTKAEIRTNYSKYQYRKPEGLIRQYLESKGITDAKALFAEDTWQLFGYAVQYRNLLAHECTYLGMDKFPSLIEACEEVLAALAKLEGVGAQSYT